MRPHKSRHWLTSPDKRENPERYNEQVETICTTYLEAPQLEEQGTHVISCDEKTGMQALERKHPTLPPRPGLAERIEFEYIRHGTLCLIANWDVAAGRLREATIGPTRTEQDFAAHVKATSRRQTMCSVGAPRPLKFLGWDRSSTPSNFRVL